VLDHAYQMGAAAALEDFEKQAGVFGSIAKGIGSLGKGVGQGAWNAGKGFGKSKTFKALKWGTGMGGRGSEWIGAPVGSAILGGVMAEEGQGMRGMLTGGMAGLAGTAGWHGGKGIAKGVMGSAGKEMAKTQVGKSIMGGVNQFGAKGGKLHNALGSKFKSIAGSDKSIGNMAMKQWAPAGVGMAAGVGGAMAATGPGEQVGGLAADYMGARSRPANYFSPAG